MFFALFLVQQVDGQVLVASSSAKKVITGRSFTVKFELKGGRGSNFNPPNFKGFKRIAGPNTSSSTTIINGKMSSSYSLSFTLLAQKPGKYTIGAASMQVGGKKVVSRPIVVEVVEAGKVEGGPQYFVRAEMESDTGYVGQQMRLHLKLYTRVTIERFDLIAQPEFGDIYVEDIPIFRRENSIEEVEGVQYNTQILQSIALFPQKSGKYDLDGFVMRLGLPEEGGRRRSSGFFFTSRLQMVDVSTDGIELEVLPLPDPKPVSFSGGVGTYSATMKSDRTKLSTDDALSLVVNIKGDGDPRGLSAPDLNLSNDFESYDANEIGSRTNKDNEKTFVKSFEYLIIPKRPGELMLKPEFAYFDPDSQQYVVNVIDSLKLYVRKGTSESKALERFKKDQELTLAPLMERTGVTTYAKPWALTGWFWSLLGLIGLGFVGLFVGRRRQLDYDALDPEIKKRRAARKKAEKRLARAKELLPQEGSTFYEELALGMKQYLGDKLGVDPAYFTRKTIADALSSRGINDARVQEVENLLSECDLALFAGSQQVDRSAMYEKAVELVMGLEGEV